MSDPQSDLLLGLAADLDAGAAGVYDPDRTWTLADTEIAIVFGKFPPMPDRVIVLNAYRIGGSDPQYPTGRTNVQAYCRGLSDPFDVEGIAAAVDVVVLGLKDRQYGSVHVTQALDISVIPDGFDDSNRRAISLNYAFDLDLPATANRSY